VLQLVELWLLSELKLYLISATLEVKGAAMDASASDRLMPTWESFKAQMSLAPSPQKLTI